MSNDPQSPLPVGLILLRRRAQLIAAFALLGALGGVSYALFMPRQYASHTMFIPQSQEAGTSGAELLASQFGIRIPTTSTSGWGTALYVNVLLSSSLLETIVRDSLVVPEEGGRRIAVLDLLKVPEMPQEERVVRGLKAIRKRVEAAENKKLNSVDVTVRTQWPSVSLAIAERLVTAVDRFNVETRRSQVSEERKFVEERLQDAQRSLRSAEDRLQQFLQQNRSISRSSELAFAQDRLEREVALRQSVVNSLMSKHEDARINEVRDLPVVTLIERPRLPVVPESRRVGLKTFFGLLAGLGLGLLLAFVLEGLAEARRGASASTPELYRPFLALRAMFPSRFM